MGFSGLVRWSNADPEAYAKIERHVRINHNGIPIGQWHLSLKSYRSTFGLNPANPSAPPTIPASSERSIFTVTMNDTVFVLLEDPMAPVHAEARALGLTEPLTHYRNNFLTMRRPGDLEKLMVMLKARWMPVRHAAGATQNASLISMGAGTGLGMGPTGGTATGGGPGRGHPGAPPNNPLAAAEITVEGKVFSLGTDWLLRIGLVRSKDLVKGILMEGEYLPLPYLRLPEGAPDGMVSDLLASLLPAVPIDDESVFVITVPQEQWDDILWDREAEEKEKQKEKEKGKEAAQPEEEEKSEGKEKVAQGDEDIAMNDSKPSASGPAPPENNDDVYAYGVEEIPHVTTRDWEGIDKDRRSAYLAIGALRQEKLL
ncbi:hypothetical protein DFP72DRAFT_879679 [Ephemerocybe angulata]|uniref:Mediator complex subunit 20 n=1 Tax=Ephemerocybe angulata TaxID=980116 RepID=A0A8H6IA94_9AGAR|nr:hypothetical protein DFP72DRAFT_879679 [Tulosesus angulatus]